MTYFTFHLLFIVPPLVVLAFLQRGHLLAEQGPAPRNALLLVCLIALLYTTPWDNYLVYRGVWWYGADRVLATIGYVPVEEYAFFALQPLLTGLFFYRVSPLSLGTQPARGTARAAGVLVYGGLLVAGILLLLSTWAPGLYLGLILTWSAPVLCLMWGYGGHVIWSLRRPFSIGVAVPTAYLWVADRTAIALGIWDISDRYSLGLDPLGLPIEEAVFFLVTNLLVVQGLILFLHGDILHARPRSRAS